MLALAATTAGVAGARTTPLPKLRSSTPTPLSPTATPTLADLSDPGAVPSIKKSAPAHHPLPNGPHKAPPKPPPAYPKYADAPTDVHGYQGQHAPTLEHAYAPEGAFPARHYGDALGAPAYAPEGAFVYGHGMHAEAPLEASDYHDYHDDRDFYEHGVSVHSAHPAVHPAADADFHHDPHHGAHHYGGEHDHMGAVHDSDLHGPPRHYAHNHDAHAYAPTPADFHNYSSPSLDSDDYHYDVYAHDVPAYAPAGAFDMNDYYAFHAPMHTPADASDFHDYHELHAYGEAPMHEGHASYEHDYHYYDSYSYSGEYGYGDVGGLYGGLYGGLEDIWGEGTPYPAPWAHAWGHAHHVPASVGTEGFAKGVEGVVAAPAALKAHTKGKAVPPPTVYEHVDEVHSDEGVEVPAVATQLDSHPNSEAAPVPATTDGDFNHPSVPTAAASATDTDAVAANAEVEAKGPSESASDGKVPRGAWQRFWHKYFGFYN